MEYFVSLVLLVLFLAVVIFCVVYILGVLIGKLPLPTFPAFGRG